MTHMSEQEFLEVQHRMKITQDSIDKDHDEGPESNLASKIREYAKNKGYPCLIHPQTRKLSWFVPQGYPDIILSLPHGITIYIELKSKQGRWGDDQKLMAMQLTQLGHQYYKIKSFKAFLQLVSKDHLEF